MSKVILDTKEFASMLSRVSKCSVKGGVDILAELIELRLNNGVLSLRTTDSRNIMILRKSGVEGDDFVATISLDVFEKIVSRTSKEKIELVVDDRAVELRGNGVYNFPLTIEGDEPITFKPLELLDSPDLKKQLKVADIRKVIAVNGGFVGSPFVYANISGFYFSDNAVSTDSIACSYLRKKLFEDEPIMLYPQTLQLVADMTEEDVTFIKKGNSIQFVSATCLVSSVSHSEIDEFPIEGLNNYLNSEFTSNVTISRKAARDILDRVSFFVDMKAEFGATVLDFTEAGITITDRRGKASEVLPYSNPVNFEPYTCFIPAADFMKILDLDGDDNVKLWYGNDDAIRVDSGDITRILALLSDNDFDNGVDFGSDESQEASQLDEAIPDVEFSEVESDNLSDIQW